MKFFFCLILVVLGIFGGNGVFVRNFYKFFYLEDIIFRVYVCDVYLLVINVMSVGVLVVNCYFLFFKVGIRIASL